MLTAEQWIGVNTEYLSLEGTSTVQVIIATATAAANGQNIGDVSIIIPEGLSAALRDSVKAALSLCGEVLKKARRQADAGTMQRLILEARLTNIRLVLSGQLCS